MHANPILAELIRNNWVENRHRGAFCFADANGSIIASTGDVERPVFPRSAIKSMQALAMFRSGAVEKFGLDNEAIALACASHNGEPAHVSGVQRVLDAIGCTVADLECGAHLPADPGARAAMRAAGETPTAIHNNCSGKHAGMLAVARALDVPTAGYVRREHPVQQLVCEAIEAVTAETLTVDRCGTDGCSIPTWAAPLSGFARGFARMATGENLSADLAGAAKRIFDAATTHPFLVRGTGGLDTEVMQAFNGRLMIKIGAEGVYCGAIRDKGIGFALKIDDGNQMAAEVVVAALLLEMAEPDAAEREALEDRAINKLKNWRGMDVARLVATEAAQPILRGGEGQIG